jgi:DNA-directed RNA polymerase alpha subunit
MSPKEVLEIRGIARKSLEEIEWELRDMGLELGVEADRR